MRIPHASSSLFSIRLPYIPLNHNRTRCRSYRRKHHIRDLCRSLLLAAFFSNADDGSRIVLVLELVPFAGDDGPAFADETGSSWYRQRFCDDIEAGIQKDDFPRRKLTFSESEGG